ncbi:hypothetical protein GCM10009860_11990 [Microbacterium mitrae]
MHDGNPVVHDERRTTGPNGGVSGRMVNFIVQNRNSIVHNRTLLMHDKAGAVGARDKQRRRM